MAITGKPHKPAPAIPMVPPVDEQTVRKLINQGGSVAEGARANDPGNIKPMLVQLRLYPDMIQEIDALRNNTGGRRMRAPSRHAWIVKAIEEKLAREKGM